MHLLRISHAHHWDDELTEPTRLNMAQRWVEVARPGNHTRPGHKSMGTHRMQQKRTYGKEIASSHKKRMRARKPSRSQGSESMSFTKRTSTTGHKGVLFCWFSPGSVLQSLYAHISSAHGSAALDKTGQVFLVMSMVPAGGFFSTSGYRIVKFLRCFCEPPRNLVA